MDAERTTRRLFFAVWPDEQTRLRLTHAASGLLRRGGGRPVPPANFHLTLAFLGNVEPARLPDIEAAGDRCQGEPFTITLDRLGFWRRSRILWLGASEVPGPLRALAETLWSSLDACGFERERRTFHPHVTLARRAAPLRRAGTPAPIAWSVDGFSLVESVAGQRGSQYEVLATWPLGVEVLAG